MPITTNYWKLLLYIGNAHVAAAENREQEESDNCTNEHVIIWAMWIYTYFSKFTSNSKKTLCSLKRFF